MQHRSAPKIADEHLRELLALVEAGKRCGEIAALFGVHRSTISFRLGVARKRFGIEPANPPAHQFTEEDPDCQRCGLSGDHECLRGDGFQRPHAPY